MNTTPTARQQELQRTISDNGFVVAIREVALARAASGELCADL